MASQQRTSPVTPTPQIGSAAPPSIPPRIHLLAKPTGAACNLACAYCFYLKKKSLYSGSTFRMSDEILETYIRQLIEAHLTQQVTMAWQGGEPTLIGLDFYRRAIELQKRYARPGMVFENTMQTNGTLLNDDWCRFFKENDFLIGISIDGPRELHDAYRRDKEGKGTFAQVLQGVRLLQKHRVEYNVLVAVNRVNAGHPLEVYRFLRDELGASWIQLIPVVERFDHKEGRGQLLQQGSRVSDRSVKPAQFGRFLIDIFDEWVRRDVGRVYVQTFEAAARRWLGLPSGMCAFEKTCGLGLALEHNGDLYACDHFVEPDYRLGNIRDQHMIDMVASEKQRLFGRDKRDALPRSCLACDVRFACHGECPKNRFIKTPDGEPGLNYLCAGFKHFFHHIDYPAKLMAGLIRRGRPAAEVMAILAAEESKMTTPLAKVGRNDPCPCGSGRKVKRCHGRPESGAPIREPLPANYTRR
ncbi:MAG: anaerobic sulfatase maturase [Deltaproteobacteria bacterium]|jgi:uncharacterized protein